MPDVTAVNCSSEKTHAGMAVGKTILAASVSIFNNSSKLSYTLKQCERICDLARLSITLKHCAFSLA